MLMCELLLIGHLRPKLLTVKVAVARLPIFRIVKDQQMVVNPFNVHFEKTRAFSCVHETTTQYIVTIDRVGTWHIGRMLSIFRFIWSFRPHRFNFARTNSRFMSKHEAHKIPGNSGKRSTSKNFHIHISNRKLALAWPENLNKLLHLTDVHSKSIPVLLCVSHLPLVPLLLFHSYYFCFMNAHTWILAIVAVLSEEKTRLYGYLFTLYECQFSFGNVHNPNRKSVVHCYHFVSSKITMYAGLGLFVSVCLRLCERNGVRGVLSVMYTKLLFCLFLLVAWNI